MTNTTTQPHLYCHTNGAPFGHPGRRLGKAMFIDHDPTDWDSLSLEWRILVRSILMVEPDLLIINITTEVIYQ